LRILDYSDIRTLRLSQPAAKPKYKKTPADEHLEAQWMAQAEAKRARKAVKLRVQAASWKVHQ